MKRIFQNPIWLKIPNKDKTKTTNANARQRGMEHISLITRGAYLPKEAGIIRRRVEMVNPKDFRNPKDVKNGIGNSIRRQAFRQCWSRAPSA